MMSHQLMKLMSKILIILVILILGENNIGASNKNISNINNFDKDNTSLRQLCAHAMSYKDPSLFMTRFGGSYV